MSSSIDSCALITCMTRLLNDNHDLRNEIKKNIKRRCSEHDVENNQNWKKVCRDFDDLQERYNEKEDELNKVRKEMVEMNEINISLMEKQKLCSGCNPTTKTTQTDVRYLNAPN